MRIEPLTQPQFRDEWTAVTLTGEHEEDVLNILTSALVRADYVILIEDEDGEMINLEDYDYGT